MRLNIASPRHVIAEALGRIARAQVTLKRNVNLILWCYRRTFEFAMSEHQLVIPGPMNKMLVSRPLKCLGDSAP